jgi:ribonuclease I
MRTTPQAVGSEESNNTGSSSKSRKTVLIKKRGSNPSRFPVPDLGTMTCADSSEQREPSAGEDFEAQIALRAYELYRQRGGCHGEDQADWFEAERQILSTV